MCKTYFKKLVNFLGKHAAVDLGPTLGLKKSSSLESLQTAVQEVVQEDLETEEAFYRQHTNKGKCSRSLVNHLIEISFK